MDFFIVVLISNIGGCVCSATALVLQVLLFVYL